MKFPDVMQWPVVFRRTLVLLIVMAYVLALVLQKYSSTQGLASFLALFSMVSFLTFGALGKPYVYFVYPASNMDEWQMQHRNKVLSVSFTTVCIVLLVLTYAYMLFPEGTMWTAGDQQSMASMCVMLAVMMTLIPSHVDLWLHPQVEKMEL